MNGDIFKVKFAQQEDFLGSRCGSVGRAVASDSKGPEPFAQENLHYRSHYPVTSLINETRSTKITWKTGVNFFSENFRAGENFFQHFFQICFCKRNSSSVSTQLFSKLLSLSKQMLLQFVAQSTEWSLPTLVDHPGVRIRSMAIFKNGTSPASFWIFLCFQIIYIIKL